jgi:serine protease Do
MTTRKSTFFYTVLIAVASLVVGMVISARFDLTSSSLAGTLAGPTINSAPLTGPIDATTFRTIAHDASPAVVSISIRGTRPATSMFGDLFGNGNGRNRGGGRGAQPAPQEYMEGAGSGFVIDKSGLILTNNHVIDEATTIDVSFSDARAGDESYPAVVVGRDELTDTALIRLTKLPDHPLTVAKFGDSAQMAPGDWVMAIGNPFRLSNSVTVGIVSAVGRPYAASVGVTGARYEEMIQTDAAINKGNSGGPLLNVRGEVIGINTMIYSDNSQGGNIGIGFAVPINKVHALLPQLEAGKVVRGRIAVSLFSHRITREDMEDLALPAVGGATIASVDDGPAKAAGMKVGDVVVEFNGKPVQDNDSLIAMVTSTTPGTTVPVKVVRAKKTLTLNVKVEELDLAQEQGQETIAAARQNEDRNTPKDTGFGMTIQEITPSAARTLQGKGGAVVSSVDPLGQAAQAGLNPGDVILSVNDEEVKTLDQVSKALDAVATGRTARLIVSSRGQERLVLVRKR